MARTDGQTVPALLAALAWPSGASAAQVAAWYKVQPSRIAEARIVVAYAADVVDRVRSGTMTLRQAWRVAHARRQRADPADPRRAAEQRRRAAATKLGRAHRAPAAKTRPAPPARPGPPAATPARQPRPMPPPVAVPERPRAYPAPGAVLRCQGPGCHAEATADADGRAPRWLLVWQPSGQNGSQLPLPPLAYCSDGCYLNRAQRQGRRVAFAAEGWASHAVAPRREPARASGEHLASAGAKCSRQPASRR